MTLSKLSRRDFLKGAGATGGYDANPEMMQAWVRPEDYEYSSWWNPSWGTTGDGHMMGLAVGAEMDSLPQPVMNFSNATPSTFVEKRVYFPGAMNWGIMVTEEGKRFTNENNQHGLVLSRPHGERLPRVHPRGRLSLERLPRAFAVRFQHQRGHRDAGRQAGHRRVP